MRRAAAAMRTKAIGAMLLALLFFLVHPAVGHAMNPYLDGFNIYHGGTVAIDGSVHAVAVQGADGKVVIGGDFTLTGGTPEVTLRNIARLNPDGTLDSSFTPPVLDGPVHAVALQPDPVLPAGPELVLIGGAFTSAGGVPRKGLARLSGGDGALDAFDPVTAAGPVTVHAITLLPSKTSIVVGGVFAAIKDGVPTRNLVGLSAAGVTSGELDWRYTGGLGDDAGNAAVYAVVLQDESVVVGGEFVTPGSANMARFTSLGVYDGTFVPPAPGGVVRALAVQVDGKVVLGGDFSGGALARAYLARLMPDGTPDGFDAALDTAPGFLVSAIALQPDGRIVAGGRFTVGPLGDRRVNLARFNIDQALDPAPFPAPDAALLALVRQGDGKLVAGGEFTAAGGVPRTALARFYQTGVLDDDIPQIVRDDDMELKMVFRVAPRPDGRTFIAGSFENVLGEPVSYSAGLTPKWSFDYGFGPIELTRRILSVATIPDRGLLLGGDFTFINGELQQSLMLVDDAGASVPAFNAKVESYMSEAFGAEITSIVQPARGPLGEEGMFYTGGDSSLSGSPWQYLARYLETGERDERFVPASEVDSYVNALAMQHDDLLVVGTLAGKVMRLLPSGNLDPAWHGGTPLQFAGELHALAVLADGRILVAGDLQYPGFITNPVTGETEAVKRNIVLLDSDGAVDESFVMATRSSDPFYAPTILGTVVQTDGGIIIYGVFDQVQDGFGTLLSRHYVARIMPEGRLDPDFDLGLARPLSSPQLEVSVVALQPDGKIILGGNFDNFGARSKLARVYGGWSSEDLSVAADGTSITWRRSGRSAELWRAWFEYSADGVQWDFLGHAERTAGGWRLQGLDPERMGGNVNRYVRARGFTAGNVGSAGALVEAVRLYRLKQTKIKVTVTARDAAKTYGDADPALTYSFTPELKAGDGFTGSISRTAGEDVGSFPITQGTLALGSGYELVFVGAQLTIGQRGLVIKADDLTKTAGLENPTLTAGFNGFAPWDSAASLGGLPALSTAVDAATPKGSYPIRVSLGSITSANYRYSFVDGTLTVIGKPQQITLPVPAPRTWGDPDFAAGGSASSGLPVAYVSSNTSVATVVNGEIRIGAAGSTVVTASQPGNGYWDPAAPVSVTCTVLKAPLLITAENKTKVAGSPTPELTAVFSGLASWDTPSSLGGAPLLATTANASAPKGTYPITAGLGGITSANYQYRFADGTLTVTGKPQSIIPPVPVTMTYGDPPIAAGGSSNSGLPLAYTSTDPTVATVVDGEIHPGTAGSTVITISQPGDDFWDPATPVTVPCTVDRARLTVVAEDKSRAYLTPNPDLTVLYRGFVKGEGNSVLSGAPTLSTTAVLASPVGSYPIMAGVGTLQAANYRIAAVDGTLNVFRSCQEITFPAIPERTFGDPPFEIVASACSGLPLTFRSSDPGVARIVGNVVTITGAGSAVITASQGGSGDLETAPEKSQTFIVHRSGQQVTFSSPAQKVVGDPPFELEGSATSGLAVSYQSSDPTVANVSGSTVTIVGAGTTVLSALQPGNGNYLAAAPVSRALTVAAEGTPPELSLSTLSSGGFTSTPVLNLLGRASDASGIASLTVQGIDRSADASLFSAAVVLSEGTNSVSVAARDRSGNLTTHTFSITLDPLAPKLEVTAPADNSVTDATSLAVTGTVPAGSTVAMTVNGEGAQLLAVTDGAFAATAALLPGGNTIEFTAEREGRSSRVKRSVTSAANGPSVAIASPPQDMRTEAASVVLRGSCGTVADGGLTLAVNGTTAPLELSAGLFEREILLRLGENRVTVEARSATGEVSVAQRNLIRVERIAGDLNGDGRVDLGDAARLLRVSLGEEEASAEVMAHCDLAPLVDGVPKPDGVIDVGDVLVLLRRIVGLAFF
ncbi:MBG domain-containing protein [Geomonas ferrireducens]|uniref:MBG domain-containing protein n=1 Tax=Geomonas ferrireducens TaxID=2570227 RepID=UPI0013A5E53C|nr:MBG domain-containing protein [Geomonas ferrireducens]